MKNLSNPRFPKQLLGSFPFLKKGGTFLLFSFLLFCACNKDEPNKSSKPYFEFDDSDYELIIDYEYQVGQIITYENQFGEQLHFKVISNKEGKAEKHGVFSNLLYYYDRQVIHMGIIENYSENQGDYKDQWVNYISAKTNNHKTSSTKGEFKNAINLPIWNIESSSFIVEAQNAFNINLKEYNDNAKTQMSINGHLFKRVVVIESAIDTPDIGDGVLPNNVHRLYYDYDFGIIRFDDLDGKQWEVVYPD